MSIPFQIICDSYTQVFYAFNVFQYSALKGVVSLYLTRPLTNKRSSKIQANYTLEGTVLENVESIKYLGVTITNDLKWNTHISNVCTKANRTLGFLRRNLYSCPPDVKEAAYKGLVRPVLEYGSSVWDPHTHGLQEELEKVQNRGARFVMGNYVFETGSMTGILGQLKWESLKKGGRIVDLYCYTKV